MRRQTSFVVFSVSCTICVSLLCLLSSIAYFFFWYLLDCRLLAFVSNDGLKSSLAFRFTPPPMMTKSQMNTEQATATTTKINFCSFIWQSHEYKWDFGANTKATKIKIHKFGDCQEKKNTYRFRQIRERKKHSSFGKLLIISHIEISYANNERISCATVERRDVVESIAYRCDAPRMSRAFEFEKSSQPSALLARSMQYFPNWNFQCQRQAVIALCRIECVRACSCVGLLCPLGAQIVFSNFNLVIGQKDDCVLFNKSVAVHELRELKSVCMCVCVCAAQWIRMQKLNCDSMAHFVSSVVPAKLVARSAQHSPIRVS